MDLSKLSRTQRERISKILTNASDQITEELKGLCGEHMCNYSCPYREICYVPYCIGANILDENIVMSVDMRATYLDSGKDATHEVGCAIEGGDGKID